MAGTCRGRITTRPPSWVSCSSCLGCRGQPARGAIASTQALSTASACFQLGIWAARSLPTTNTSALPGHWAAARSRVVIAQGLLSSCRWLSLGSPMAATSSASRVDRCSRGAPWCFWGLSLAQVATVGYSCSRPSSRAWWPRVGGSALVPNRAIGPSAVLTTPLLMAAGPAGWRPARCARPARGAPGDR